MEWIKTSDRLPNQSETVWVMVDGEEVIGLGYMLTRPTIWYLDDTDNIICDEVTHWLPKSETPKEI